MINGTTPQSVNDLFNSTNFLRRQKRTREPKEEPPRRILSDAEKNQIYHEYKNTNIAIKTLCNNNKICVSTLYNTIIPFIKKQNGIMESENNVKILNLDNEIQKTFNNNKNIKLLTTNI